MISKTLSDKRNSKPVGGIDATYFEKDVKEFIRELKKMLNVKHAIVPVEIIDKLAGDKLI